MYKLVSILFLVLFMTGCSLSPILPAQTKQLLTLAPSVTSPPSTIATLLPSATRTTTTTSIPSATSTAVATPLSTATSTSTPIPRIPIGPDNIDQLALVHVFDVVGGKDVAWSPDGKNLALVNEAGVSIFDATNLTQIQSFPIKGGGRYLLFNSDGSKLAVSDATKWIKVLDPNTGKVLSDVKSFTDIKDFCPNGEYLTSDSVPGFMYGKMDCIQYKTHVLLANTFHTSLVTSLDGTIAVLGLDQADLQVIELPSGKVLQSIKGPKQNYQIGITSLAISPDNKIVAVGDTESTTALYTVSTGEQIHLFNDQAWIGGLSFSPDGSQLAQISSIGLDVINLTDFSVQTVGGATAGAVSSIAFSPDGRWMVTDTVAGPIRFWSTTNWQEIKHNLDENSGGNKVIFSSDGAYLASNNLKIIRVWEFTSGKVVLKVDAGLQWFSCLAFSPDGKQLAIGIRGGKKNGNLKDYQSGIQIWDVMSAKLINTMIGHPYSTSDEVGNVINALAYAPDGKTLASGGWYYDNKFRLWDIETGKQLAVIAEHIAGIREILFNNDGSILFSSSADMTIGLWDLQKMETLRTLRFPEIDVYDEIPMALSPDGQLVAAATPWFMTFRIWQVKDGKVVIKQALSSNRNSFTRGMALAFSPNGGLLAVGGWDGRLRVYGVPFY